MEERRRAASMQEEHLGAGLEGAFAREADEAGGALDGEECKVGIVAGFGVDVGVTRLLLIGTCCCW